MTIAAVKWAEGRSGGRSWSLASVPVDQLSDAQLLERLFARDEAALRTVIGRYGPAVFAMSKRVLADETLAEEVAQDTFVSLWRRPGMFDPERGSLRTFLMGVARNKAVDLVRKEESLRRRAEDLIGDRALTSESADLAGSEDRSALVSALTALSPIQREAIVLAYFGGFTYREVADRLQIPEGTAKSRLREGLVKLRTVLGARGPG